MFRLLMGNKPGANTVCHIQSSQYFTVFILYVDLNRIALPTIFGIMLSFMVLANLNKLFTTLSACLAYCKPLAHLQQIQNARLCSVTAKGGHPSPILAHLQLLAVYYRVLFKVLLDFIALNGLPFCFDLFSEPLLSFGHYTVTVVEWFDTEY